MTAPEASELVVRATCLYVPSMLVIALVLHVRPGRRRIAGALLATTWNLATLLALNVVAVRVGWWRFDVGPAEVAGVPADLWVGWALLWGAVPVLATRRLGICAVALVLADLVLMPLAEPVVVLDSAWLVGEAAAVAFCLLPGLLLGRWTAQDEQLPARAVLQVVAFTCLLFFVLPSLVFRVTGEDWGPLLDRPRWHFVLAGITLAPVAAMAVQSVREFAHAGGTPVPLDPPATLVTTGPYAYVANPMQLSGTILLAAWGLLLTSAAVVAAAAMSAAFSAGLAAWNEDAELGRRFGDGWHQYRQRVRLWLPSWRPAVANPGVVYVAVSCEPCGEVGRFLEGRRPTDLELRPAEACPFPLQRISYEQAGRQATGLAAIGKSLEHVNLAWAAVSWVGRLPVLEQVLQLINDAIGFGPARLDQRDVATARKPG